MMYLPTTALKAMREGRYLTDHLGRRIVGEKLDAASKGLEMNDDLFSRLGGFVFSTEKTSTNHTRPRSGSRYA
jgi:hypothetical protein